MGLRAFLQVTLFFFLALVVAESFSLHAPASTTTTRSPSLISGGHRQQQQQQQQQHERALSYSTSHISLFKLRGGSAAATAEGDSNINNENEVMDLDAPEVVPTSNSNSNNKIMAVMDATGLTTALVAFGRLYSTSLETFPIGTKSVTAAVLFAMSDQMAQAFEIQRARKKGNDKSTKSIFLTTNKKRSLWSGIVGFCYFGPASHFWYAWVFKTFPGKSILSILQKAVLGQFFFAPPLFCVFFAAALLQNGQFTFDKWFQKIRQDLVKGWIGGLGFWPIVNYISYGYIPPKYIPLFVNCMGLIFNIYVSLIANIKQGGTTAAAGATKSKA